MLSIAKEIKKKKKKTNIFTKHGAISIIAGVRGVC